VDRGGRDRERERYLYWINSKESPLASVTAGGLAMLLLPSSCAWGRDSSDSSDRERLIADDDDTF
jgi:hypothetical protein